VQLKAAKLFADEIEMTMVINWRKYSTGRKRWDDVTSDSPKYLKYGQSFAVELQQLAGSTSTHAREYAEARSRSQRWCQLFECCVR
jgi:hypothetical protein